MLELCIPMKYLLGGAALAGTAAVGLVLWAWSTIEVDPEGPLGPVREFEGHPPYGDVPMGTSGRDGR